VSPQQRAESGERFQRARGGPGEGVGRSRGVGALVAVAGRGGEELFFFAVSTRTAQVSLEQPAPFGKRLEGSREGILKGVRRFVGNCELRVVAVRGGENFFFFNVFPADCSGVAAAAR
jgi:hypothetical protein